MSLSAACWGACLLLYQVENLACTMKQVRQPCINTRGLRKYLACAESDEAKDLTLACDWVLGEIYIHHLYPHALICIIHQHTVSWCTYQFAGYSTCRCFDAIGKCSTECSNDKYTTASQQASIRGVTCMAQYNRDGVCSPCHSD